MTEAQRLSLGRALSALAEVFTSGGVVLVVSPDDRFSVAVGSAAMSHRDQLRVLESLGSFLDEVETFPGCLAGFCDLQL